jgi:hypothetical protein
MIASPGDQMQQGTGLCNCIQRGFSLEFHTDATPLSGQDFYSLISAGIIVFDPVGTTVSRCRLRLNFSKKR